MYVAGDVRTQMKTMRAIVHDEYGAPDVLELREIGMPTISDTEVLVRVHASSANPYDWHLMTGLPYLARLLGRSAGFGLRRPVEARRGWDVAGVVEAVGAAVSRLRPGDEVFGWGDGAFAEYVAAGESHFVAKPTNLTFEQAAAVPLAALTALQAVRDQGRTQRGQKVLVNSASGGVGTFAVQIAKWLGAEVTGVCSPRNVELVRSIGADHVIDYTRDDFTRSDERYDVIIDSAVSRSLSECRTVLAPNGIYVVFGDSGGHWIGGFRRVFQAMLLAPFVSHELKNFTMRATTEDLELLRELLETGVIAPVIDRTYRLDETQRAMRYLAEGHARAKIVISVWSDGMSLGSLP